MNAKVRMCAVSAAVIAALVGCGSQVHGGAAVPPPTRPACPEGSAYPPGTRGEVDYTDSIWHDSVSYGYLPGVRIAASQIGAVVTRIRCSMATYPDTHAPPSYQADDTATALSAGTPVYAVKGFSPRCRLAAYVAGQLRAYVAVNDTERGPVPRACARYADGRSLPERDLATLHSRLVRWLSSADGADGEHVQQRDVMESELVDCGVAQAVVLRHRRCGHRPVGGHI